MAKGKAQLVPIKVFASCMTYNCQQRAEWALGDPNGPIELQHILCGECAQNIINNIPDELLPKEPEQTPIISPDDIHIGISPEQAIKIAELLPDGEEKDLLLKAIGDILDELKKEAESDGRGTPQKTYTCKHCGQEGFETPQKVAAHSRNCPKKEG